MLEGVGTAFGLAVAWAALGIAMVIPILKIFHLWLVEKVWNAGQALAIMMAALSILIVCWSALGFAATVAYVFFLLLLVVLAPVCQSVSERYAVRRMRDEDIARYKRTIAFDPENAAAHAFLADAYVERGLYDEAAEEYKQAIAMDPDRSNSERYKLRMLTEQQTDTRRSSIIVCEQCQRETPASEKYCRKCGSLLRPSFYVWISDPANARAVLAQSALIVAIFVILALFFSPLPLEVKGCLIAAGAFVGGFLIIRRMG